MFAEVILPLPLSGYFTYRVPEEFVGQIQVGMRVVVNFGVKKFYAGIVATLSENPSDNNRTVKDISEMLDAQPVVAPEHLEMWKWMASYYMCPIGEVMNAAIPAGLKMESNTTYVVHPAFSDDFSGLSDDEYLVAEAIIKAGQLTPIEIQSITGRQSVQKLIRSLIEKRIIYPSEEIEDRYVPKKQKFLTLNKDYQNEGILNALMVKLEKRSPRQYKALLSFFNQAKGTYQTTLTELNKEGGQAAVAALIKKQILCSEERVVSRIADTHGANAPEKIVLSPSQETACKEIQHGLDERKPVLLFGVTGSGKTEIFIHFIRQAMAEGKQVLYLLPEIALTDFMVSRLRLYFGNDLLVYHSRFNAQEKVEIWNEVLKAKAPKVILGARSALFLPFVRLGLIIVDEEHDSSYKQQDPAPRYHARDSAVMVSRMTGAGIILGSATPSLETWLNAQSGNYRRVDLTERFGQAEHPEVAVVDIRQASFRKKMIGPLSPELYEATKKAVMNHRQVILFQNRRGYSTWIECSQCGWSPTCRHCDVSLTYHKNIDLLKCHYCGFTDKTPSKCPSCGSAQILMKGLGTQRVEDELGIIFNDYRIARMDMDTTRGKKALSDMFRGFSDGKFDILVGTQMVTKGLDFSRVDVVGILNGDNMHTFPDFRAHEHAFQTMMQVSGRAGRRNNGGKVFIQVYDKENPIVRFVIDSNYTGFMEQEAQARKQYMYPPFVRIIRLSVLHKDKDKAEKASSGLKAALSRNFSDKQLLGPEFPPVARIKNYYIRNILIKLPRSKDLQQYKDVISEEILLLQSHPDNKGVRIIADVDPV